MDLTQGLLVIPEDKMVIGVMPPFNAPLYWSLPRNYLGDLVTSYNGFLRFTTWSNGDLPLSGSSPLAQLQAYNGRLVLEHYPIKVSSSGRYETRLHESDWVEKGGQPVDRKKFMVALHSVEKLLIRATDFSGSTSATLQGVSLDRAVPRQGSDRRPQALGVEQCTCPPKYGGTSCQDPGSGFYRWYFTSHQVTTFMDFFGDVKSCQCNGRADRCHSETGSCLGCTQNTTGSACELCAGGFYGNPLLGKPCQPCQCPSAEHNHAATCQLDRRGQFMCQCKEGYTGPSCDQCDYGFFGNHQEGCQPCRCDPLGSLSDQCHQESGQCFCRSGVTGRDCSQCGPRRVLVEGGLCRECNHTCVAFLLNTIDGITDYYRNSEVADLDPAPMVRLKRYKKQVRQFNASSQEAETAKDKIQVEMAKLMITKPHAELTMLEATKYQKAGLDQHEDAAKLLFEAGKQRQDAESLFLDVQSIVRRLRDYGRDSWSNINIAQALEEARRMLIMIKSHNYAKVDIAARMELSYARQSLNSLKELLFDRDALRRQAKSVEIIEVEVNDLLQYLNKAMDHTREAMMANQKHFSTLRRAQTSCDTFDQMLVECRGMEASNRKLLEEANEMNGKARSSFGQLKSLFSKLATWTGQLEGDESQLKNLVDKYFSQYITPCQKHSERLLVEADKVLNLFNRGRGLGAEKTLEAASAYQRIIKTVLQAGRSAEEAFTLSLKLIEKISRKNRDGFDLYGQADLGRVKSRDLRQEAEGLRQNSREMQVQIEELILRWQSYILLVSKRHDELLTVERNLDRLQIVSVLAEEAVRHSEEALRRASILHEDVMKIFEKITVDLRSKAQELLSFSPEKLGNIPRKCNEARRSLQQVDKQAAYLSHRRLDIEEISGKLDLQIQNIKDKLAMARHAAENVKISITNQRTGHPESTPLGCSRSYRVNLTSSLSTSISLVYALTDPEAKDGLLVYLPNGDPSKTDFNRDFMALEMVDRRIRFVWNNGAGTMSIWHNNTIAPSVDSQEDLIWYKITAERVGNVGRLNVRLVKPVFIGVEDNRWVVGEADPAAHVLDLHPQDLLYIGGGAIPNDLISSELKSGATFNGVVYHLELDGRIVGLWNFVTNAGCRETHSGLTQETHGTCYRFRGDGYSMQRGIRHYDPRYLSLSLEFKTFDSNALIFMAINENENFQRQHILLEIRDGRLYMELNYGPEKQMAFLSSNTYNGGGWVQAEVARALRNNVETGVLRVTFNGVREDLMDTIALPPEVVFQMKDCLMFFGGVPPTFDRTVKINRRQRAWNNFLGQMRAITISNPGSNSLINPLYTKRHLANPYYGVDSQCFGRLIKASSFNGEAYLEVPSQVYQDDSTMGFAFQTFTSNGLLVLGNFNHTSYSVSLVDGRLSFKLSSVKFVTENTFNDGQHHTVAIARVHGKIQIFVDDEIVSKDMDSPFLSQENGGLYVGGLPYLLRDKVEKAEAAASVNGLVGTISDIIFIDHS